ncbi:hypothetical protein [Paenibacillus sp. IHBB 10380]|uniref:hypothetical protein n=1 Tax=Paenibacillus sp. IHBB 10380 TaxID=1566358 RepID=UPI0005CFB674|nr:hypothetical protein [Paenibacillus sp. IHBB 10380]AJS58667.1 hypothetical protein UB51_09435 [Paenibacillus sp. IHBB 10380]
MLLAGISKLESKRRRFLVGLTIGFIIWQVPYLVSYFTSGKNHISLSGGWITWVSVAGSIIWAYSLIRMQLGSWLLRKNREMAKALNDEYMQLIWTRSFAAGFWVLMAAIAVLFTFSFWIDISTGFVLHAALFTGIVSSSLAYLSFEKE